MLRSVLLLTFLLYTPRLSAAATAGSLESHSSVSSSTVTSSKEHARLACDHVVVVNRVAHPLITKVMRQLRPQLEGSGLARKWEFIEGAQASINRARRPDLFLMIDSATINEKGLLSRSIEAAIHVRLGTDPYMSAHSRSTDEEPPLVRFKFEMDIDHKSTRKGIETEKYGMVSKEIANEMVKGLANAIKGLIEAHDVLPEFPDYMYGPQKPAPIFDFLGGAEPEFTGAGLLSHNESFWTFDVPPNFVPRLAAIAEILIGNGWRTDYAQITNGAPPDVYLTRSNAFVEIFSPGSTSAFLASTGAPKRLVLRYCEWFSRAERKEALDKLLEDEGSAETLLMFDHNFSTEQRQRLYARLKDSTIASPVGYLAIAEYCARKKDTNTAKAMLLRAYAAQQTFARKNDLDSRIEDQWREIGAKEKLALTTESLRQIGFVEFTGKPVSAEKRAGEPLLLLRGEQQDKPPATLALQIHRTRAPGTNRLHTIEILETRGGGSTRSTSSHDFSRAPTWKHRSNYDGDTIDFSAQALPGTNSFRLTVAKGDSER